MQDRYAIKICFLFNLSCKTIYLKSDLLQILRDHWCPLPGRVAQSASSIPVRSHTFVEIDHEMISTVILLPSADSFKKGCCQLQAKVCARITG